MTPPTVNAYYNPSNNEIVLPGRHPAAPVLRPDADDAVNYGAIGAVIGHEMTHGFDDQGRKFDAQGNLRDWWTPADRGAVQRAREVHRRAVRHIGRGRQGPLQGPARRRARRSPTLADGLAYRALSALRVQARGPIDGFTPEQRFFLSYAQVWRRLQNEAYTRQLAQRDPHPTTVCG